MFVCHARRVLAAGVVGALSSATLVLTPQAIAVTTPEKAELKIGSYNIQADVDPAVFDDAVKELLPRVDVVGLQEVHGDEKGRQLDKLEYLGWDHFRPELGKKNPVLWRSSRFHMVSGRTVKFTDRRYIGDERPARDTLNENFATIVRLKDRVSQQNLSVVNIHFAPGAVSAGARVPGRPRIFATYVEQVREMAEVAEQEKAWGKVFVLGDFNVGWVADEKKQKRRLPFATLKRISLRAAWATSRPDSGGTRGRALLDQIYAPQAARSAAVAFDMKFSDHYPALATYRLPVL